MAQHTPGPWTIYGSGGPWEQALNVRAERWGCVARIGVDPSVPPWDGPQRANALLIAAAPDLLEAMREAVAREYNQFEPDNQSARYKRWLLLIARATGEQQ